LIGPIGTRKRGLTDVRLESGNFCRELFQPFLEGLLRKLPDVLAARWIITSGRA